MTVDTAEGGAVAFDPGPAWRAFFATFETGARLLDLATGGGQVARLAHETATQSGKRFDVTGVDYADLGPLEGEVAPGLRLTGGVALERLPFADAAFDGATSQFGIEYADARRALAELARVLRPGGRARLLLHHTASAVSRSTAEQAVAHDRVFVDDAILRAARKAYAAHQRGAAAGALRTAEDAFREAVRRAGARLRDDPAYDHARRDLGYLADLAGNIARYAPKSALAGLETFEAGMGAWRARHASQMKAALDPAGFEAFRAKAQEAGLATEGAGEEQDSRGALIAWRLDLRRG
jgi:SAM-dependent methyltransferase